MDQIHKETAEQSLRHDIFAEKFEWDGNHVKAFDKDGNFIESYEIIKECERGAIQISCDRTNPGKAEITDSGIFIYTVGYYCHGFHLYPEEEIRYKKFLEKHENCKCDGPYKYKYYDRYGGFSNWYGLHMVCMGCGEEAHIAGEDFYGHGYVQK